MRICSCERLNIGGCLITRESWGAAYLLLGYMEGSITVKFTWVRVVCQNTLMMAMDDGQKAYRVRHSKKMQFRLEELADFLAITQEVFLKAEECFRQLAKIQMIENRLESGDDFSQLAMNYSEQPDTAGNGGDMGMISESQLRTNPEIYAAVSKLKPGATSPPLPMSDPNKHVIGYSIVRLISKEPAGQRELNDPRVQQFIREQLRDSREQLLKAAYYDVLHNQSKIDNYYADDLLKNAK